MLPKTFKILGQEYNTNFFVWMYTMLSFQDKRMKDYAGYYLREGLVEFKGGVATWAGKTSDGAIIGKAIFSSILAGKLNTQNILDLSLKAGDELFLTLDGVEKSNLSKLTYLELLDYLNRIWELICEITFFGAIPVLSDSEHLTLSNALDEAVKKKITLTGLEKNSQELVSVLATHTFETFSSQEKISILTVLCEIKKRKEFENCNSVENLLKLIKENAEIEKLFSEHVGRFKWLNYHYQGPAWGKEKFGEELYQLFTSLKSPVQELDGERKRISELKKRQEDIFKELQMGENDKKLFFAGQYFLFLKNYRVEVRNRAHYCFDLIFEEIVRRNPGITLRDLRFSTIDEIRYLLSTGSFSTTHKERAERYSYSVFAKDESSAQFYYGDSAKNYWNQMIIQDEVDMKAVEIKGQVASPGHVKGIAKIVNKASEISKVKKGDVLVSIATNPDLLPAMKLAIAFVTDSGGITSHAAITAREMKKPCVIGTKNATKILKDGDMIEVDANKGLVKKLS